ncbi:hypothetical protein ZEAMMB73_Zm00001d042491 [Zea mays]|uniref:Cullin N-terminal domain-containing protein n=1 Tax=Zea mays TaxID=4577 RepID=A0A1D6N4F2_MAIZE|nr:hypothetical protein ZEAMMB73_Zm00001d042491 [Zea mays]
MTSLVYPPYLPPASLPQSHLALLPSRRRPLYLRPPSLPPRPPALPTRYPPPLIPFDYARPQSVASTGVASPTVADVPTVAPLPASTALRLASASSIVDASGSSSPASPIRSSSVDISTVAPLLASPSWRLVSAPSAVNASGSSSLASAHSGTSSPAPMPRALLVSRSEYMLLFWLPLDNVIGCAANWCRVIPSSSLPLCDLAVDFRLIYLLKLYNEDFEDAFLKATIKYYSKKAQAWIMVDTCTEYMVKAGQSVWAVQLASLLVFGFGS